MKAFRKFIFFAIFIVFIGLFAVHFLQEQYTRVSNISIDIEGEFANRVDKNQVKNEILSKLKNYEGKPLWSLDLPSLLKELSENSRVEGFQVFRRFPNQLFIKAKLMRPVVNLMDKKGQLRPVSEKASLMPKDSFSEVLDLPILRGKTFENSKELREKAIGLIKTLPKKGWLSQRNISEVLYSQKNGIEFVLQSQGARVLFGTDNFASKISKIERVLNYLHTQGIEGRVIDGRFSKKVVVSPRNTP